MHNRYENIDIKSSLAKLDPFLNSKTTVPSPSRSPNVKVETNDTGI
jgi:hypothetical protein